MSWGQGLIHAITHLKSIRSTVIIITHRPNILQVTNKLLVMRDGLLEMYGSTHEVLAKLRGVKTQQPQSKPQAQPQPKQPQRRPVMQKVTLGKPNS